MDSDVQQIVHDQHINDVGSTQRSPAWNYFELCTKEFRKAICNKCSKVLKLPTSTTSPMLKHLFSKHPECYQECIKEKNKRKNSENISTDEPSKRQKVATYTKAELDQLCMEMIAMDLKSFSSVEDKGFRRILKKIDDTYNPPCRTTCSRSLCPKLYEETKQKLMDELTADKSSGLMSLSLSTDGWKSRSGHHYLSLTLHYITTDFKLKNITLGMKQLEERHSGYYLKLKLHEMLTEWDLSDVPNTPIFFITDNAHNISSAIRQGGWNHIYCFAHTLQLALKDARKYTKGIDGLLTKARRIATHFHHLDPARQEFEKAQKDLNNQPPLGLIQMVPTRWNSEYEMLERMKRLQKPLSNVLSSCTNIKGLTGLDWKRINDIINVMSPLNEAMKISCGSKYPTLSMIEPMLHGIKSALENLQFSNEPRIFEDIDDPELRDSEEDENNNSNYADIDASSSKNIPNDYNNDPYQPMGANFAQNIIRVLAVRFSKVEDETLYQKRTFLDPRYKIFF